VLWRPVGVTVGAGVFLKLQLDALHAAAALDDMAEGYGRLGREAFGDPACGEGRGGQDFDGLTQQLGRMVKGLKDNSEEGNKTASALGTLYRPKMSPRNGRAEVDGNRTVETS